MPWKLEENGAIAVVDGNPVWIYEGGDKDGQEAPVAFDNTLKTITRLTAESTQRKTKLGEANATLAKLEAQGVDLANIDEYLTNANTAIERVANLSEQETKHEQAIAQIKQSAKESYDLKIKATIDAHQIELGKKDDRIAQQDASIRSLVIQSAFDQSEFLREHTVLPSDVAFKYLGDRFDVEVVDNKPVGYAKDAEGNKLMSLKNPGETASPSEAIELLINSHPQKDSLLKMNSSGSGTPPNKKPGSGSGDLITQYSEAKKNGNTLLMGSLKRQMVAQGIKAPL